MLGGIIWCTEAQSGARGHSILCTRTRIPVHGGTITGMTVVGASLSRDMSFAERWASSLAGAPGSLRDV